DVSDAAGNPATEAAQSVTVDRTPPSIAISSPIAGDNVIDAAEAGAGFTVSGTTVGAEAGRTVTVKILDSSNNLWANITTTTAGNGSWSAPVAAAQAQVLADGSYTVTADVSDAAGNPANEARQSVTVAQIDHWIRLGSGNWFWGTTSNWSR